MNPKSKRKQHGGTPSALAPEQLRQLLEAVHKYLPLAPDCEITVEGRVHNFTEDKARACFDGGANRLSIGVQTFKERLRNRLGRKAGRAQIIDFLETLVGMDQAAIVIDLIYGFPDQSLEEWEDDVRTAIATGIHGIDLYALTLIDSTPLVPAIKNGKFPPAPASTEKGEYYRRGAQLMYEARWQGISSTHWRRDTRERNFYNLMVKSGANCLAFGSGAGGFLNGYSFRKESNLESYMERVETGDKAFGFLMKQPDNHALYNRIKGEMKQGRLNIAWLAQQLGHDWEHAVAPLIWQWESCGLLTFDGGWIDLTLAGRFWQVTMTVNLLEWIKLNLKLPDFFERKNDNFNCPNPTRNHINGHDCKAR
ncbi:radical SAM protein [Profundibacter sp.]